MKRATSWALAAVLLMATTGCWLFGSKRYEPEPLPPPGDMSQTPASTDATMSGNGLIFNGLVEYGRGMLGFNRTSKGEGTLLVDGDRIEWRNADKSDRNFSIKADVISDVWLTCARRPPKNLCLEIGIRTLTDHEYHFRDRNWAGGENTQILQIFDYFRVNYTHVVYDQKTVDKID